jgi:colicin import membrane protein
MGKPDWLSIDEITRLWSEETGREAAAFQKDLESWFNDFVKQHPSSPSLMSGENAGATNRLMGMLGARYLEKTTFETYCENRGHPKPRFWFDGRTNAVRGDDGRADDRRGDDARGDDPRGDDPRGDKLPNDDLWNEDNHGGGPQPSQPAPARSEAVAAWPGDVLCDERDERDPELTAFQTQIANLGKRLETPKVEIPSVGMASPVDQRRLPTRRGQAALPARRDQPNLNERTEAALEEARDLKARLEAAEHRIADLCLRSEPSQPSSAARPSNPGPASPRQHDASTYLGPDPRSRPGYKDPNATSQLLHMSTARPRSRTREILLAGLAVILGGLLLGKSIEAPTLAALSEQFHPKKALQSLENMVGTVDAGNATAHQTTRSRGTGDRDPLADDQDLVAARQQIAQLSATVAASDATVARLQDELAAARQEAETAHRSNAGAGSVPTREERLWSQALSAEVEIAGVRAALQQAEEQATQAEKARKAAESEAAKARTALASTERETATLRKRLDAAKAKVADADKSAAGTRAEFADLRAESARLREENARLMTELDKAQADLADLRAALKKAELIANLKKVVGTVGD